MSEHASGVQIGLGWRLFQLFIRLVAAVLAVVLMAQGVIYGSFLGSTLLAGVTYATTHFFTSFRPESAPSTRLLSGSGVWAIAALVVWVIRTALAESMWQEVMADPFQRAAAASMAAFVLLAPLGGIPLALKGNQVHRRSMEEAVLEQRRALVDAARQREVEYEKMIIRQQSILKRPSRPGRMTGFEPSVLARRSLPSYPHMYGCPGVGLSGSNFDSTAVALGQAGEENFAKALDAAGLLSKFATFWSVQMPAGDLGASQTYASDIDCVLVTGRVVLLVDVKNYTQGDATWRVEDGQLFLFDNMTGHQVGQPRSMSNNMKLANERVWTRLRRVGVEHAIIPRVVLMPTDNGLGAIDGVSWPGDIRAETLMDTLAQLQQEPPFDPAADESEHIIRVLRWLLKDESGSAPRLN